MITRRYRLRRQHKKNETSKRRVIVIVNILYDKITLQPLSAHLYLQCSIGRRGWQRRSLFTSRKKTEKKKGFFSEEARKLKVPKV